MEGGSVSTRLTCSGTFHFLLSICWTRIFVLVCFEIGVSITDRIVFKEFNVLYTLVYVVPLGLAFVII